MQIINESVFTKNAALFYRRISGLLFTGEASAVRTAPFSEILFYSKVRYRCGSSGFQTHRRGSSPNLLLKI